MIPELPVNLGLAKDPKTESMVRLPMSWPYRRGPSVWTPGADLDPIYPCSWPGTIRYSSYNAVLTKKVQFTKVLREESTCSGDSLMNDACMGSAYKRSPLR